MIVEGADYFIWVISMPDTKQFYHTVQKKSLAMFYLSVISNMKGNTLAHEWMCDSETMLAKPGKAQNQQENSLISKLNLTRFCIGASRLFFQLSDSCCIIDLIFKVEQDMAECIAVKLRSYIGNADLDTVFVTVFTELYIEYDVPLRLLFMEENAPHFSQVLKTRLAPIFAERISNHYLAETAYIIEFYLSGILAVVGRWFSEKDGLSLEEFAQIIKSIVDGMGQSGLLSFRN